MLAHRSDTSQGHLHPPLFYSLLFSQFFFSLSHFFFLSFFLVLSTTPTPRTFHLPVDAYAATFIILYRACAKLFFFFFSFSHFYPFYSLIPHSIIRHLVYHPLIRELSPVSAQQINKKKRKKIFFNISKKKFF